MFDGFTDMVDVPLGPNEGVELKTISKKLSISEENSKWGQKDLDILSIPSFQITWRNLSAKVPSYRESSGRFYTDKLALSGVNGSFSSGQLVGILGPSGSGKTILLESITGLRKRGLSGTVSVSSNKAKLLVSHVPQGVQLFEHFTVRETFIYASYLKNLSCTSEKTHEDSVQSTISDLFLDSCSGTLVGNCSGGQRKRISIGQELIWRPDILILDDAASGLDSVMCFEEIRLLKKLTTGRNQNSDMSVIAVLHQTPTSVFNFFDQVYILSTQGECIYEGSPKTIDRFLQITCPTCSLPNHCNPADFLVEIGGNEYGSEIVRHLTDIHRKKWMSSYVVSSGTFQNELTHQYQSNCQNQFSFRTFWVILRRSASMIWRDPVLNVVRLLGSLLLPFMYALYFSRSGIETEKGCPPINKAILSMNGIELMEIPTRIENIARTELVLTYAYSFCISILMVISYWSLLVTLLTFPLEFKLLRHEHFNGWYGLLSYYLGRYLAELPFLLANGIISGALAYLLIGFPFELKRLFWFTGSLVLVSFVAQSYGFLLGGLFESSTTLAMICSAIGIAAQLIYSGFFVRAPKVWPSVNWMNHLSHIRYGFESMIVSIYGFDRCVCNFSRPSDDDIGDWVRCISLDPAESSRGECLQDGGLTRAFSQLNVGGPRGVSSCNSTYLPIPYSEYYIENDSTLSWSWLMMAIQIIVLHILSYWVVRWKLASK